MQQTKYKWLRAFSLVWAVSLASVVLANDSAADEVASIGSVIFHDPSLSNPPGQSCATCHVPFQAFAQPGFHASPGANSEVSGQRNSPSLLYTGYIGEFTKNQDTNLWQGGLFWDGRANSFQEQVEGPWFNAIEMGNTREGLAAALRNAGYAQNLQTLFGPLTSDDAWVAAAADALAAFQKSDVFRPFSAKYDYVKAGLLSFTPEEALGEEIFNGKGFCSDCHSGVFDGHELFTRFEFHNVSTPRNDELGFYKLDKTFNPAGVDFVDRGLAENPRVPEHEREAAVGLFRTPTLRNVAVTAPYMHNGSLQTLVEVVEFYNELSAFWPAESMTNLSAKLISQLDLSASEKKALVAFLETLTDEYEAPYELRNQLRELHASGRHQTVATPNAGE